jgi:hypothetical protein
VSELDEKLDGQLAAVMQTVRNAPQRQLENPTSDVRKMLHDLLRDGVRPGIDRLRAERNGWREIAKAMLEVATDGDMSATEIPPLELLELHAIGQLEAKFKPAIAQFWADVTREHEQRRKRTLDRANIAVTGVEAGTALRAGELLKIGADGIARRLASRELERLAAMEQLPQCTCGVTGTTLDGSPVQPCPRHAAPVGGFW